MSESAVEHLAVIMDGNRRWAQARGLPAVEGHRRGYETLKKAVEWCLGRQIKYLTVWAFSTENWQRSEEEVNFLMELLKLAFVKELPFLQEKNVKLKIIGERKNLSSEIKEIISQAELATLNNTAMSLIVAFNYGGRDELVRAVKKIIQQGVAAKEATGDLISQQLDTAGLPDPDLVIRTSGEQRLSGFLPWQSAYSELYFMPKYWPEFTEQDLDQAITEFKRRQRKFGK